MFFAQFADLPFFQFDSVEGWELQNLLTVARLMNDVDDPTQVNGLQRLHLNIRTGQDVSKSGSMTWEVSYRWLDAIYRTNDVLQFVAERDKYEEYNFGLRFVFRPQ